MKLRIASLALLTILCLALGARASVLYSNGPTNGTSDAYYIDIFLVTDSFAPSVNGLMTSFTFAEWVPHSATPSATPLTVDWAVGSSSFGNQLGFGTAYISLTNVAPVCSAGSSYNGGICGGGFPYDVVNVTIGFPAIPVNPGSPYYLTLTNATDIFGGRDAWDINSGPSLAYHNLLGQIPSESFTISDAPGQATPEPSSILLFGSGILGIAGVLRRKLNI